MVRVVILRSRSTGGIESRVLRVATELRKAGHRVTAFLWDREGAYAREETREGIRIRRVHLPAPYNRLSLFLPLALWLLVAYRATRGARIVHACDLDTLPAALAAKTLRGSRVVYDIFDFYGHLITAPLRAETRQALLDAEVRLATHADALILPDEARRVVLPPAFPRPLEIVMNTPRERVVEVPKEEGFVLFHGGNLAPDRGLWEAASALRGLENIRLRVVGTGELRARVEALAATEPHVTFLGEMEHAAFLEEMAKAHAVLAWYDPRVPANRYASPNKLFEAMMLGIPVLVSAGTSMADIVSRTGCGLVIPYGREDALQEAILRLQDDPAVGEGMGSRGRRAYEREYNWDNMRARLRSLYDQIVV
ncbi:MAG: glycosyltransferase family 4 protein [Thermoplasmata archaeon]